MWRKWILTMCVGLATVTMACSDDDKKDEKKTTCVASCKDKVLTTCDANGIAKTEACAECNADGVTCKPKTTTCTPSCRGKVLTTCDGNTAKTEACAECNADGVTCKTKTTTCTPSCSGNVVTTCDGNTAKTETCAECDDDGVTCKTETCTPSCSGNVVTTCDANGDAREAPCLPGCNDDGVTCKTEVHDDNIDKDILPVPEGQKNDATEICDPATFVDHCDGNTQIYCAMNSTYGVYQVSHSDCLNDTVCVVTLETNMAGSRVNYTNCLEACDQNVGTVKVECDIDTYDSSEILVTKTCVNSSKGKLWNDRIEHCAGECSQNACAEKDKACEGEEDRCGEDGNIVACMDGIVHYTSCTREGWTCGESGGAISCGIF